MVTFLYFSHVGYEFVYLLFAELQTMEELLVHQLPQLELVGRAQVIERGLRLVETGLFKKDGLSILERIVE